MDKHDELTRLAELAGRWRRWADAMYQVGQSNRVRDCADELEAELLTLAHGAKTGGLAEEWREAVVWLLGAQPHDEFSHSFIKDEKKCARCKRMKQIREMLAASPPAAQHAGPAVDDAMVERAFDAFMFCSADSKTGIRAALTAALTPQPKDAI